MNNMEIFRNKEFGSVRVLEDGDKYLFCGSDVAKALGYARPNDALSRHCRYTAKRSIPHPQAAGKTIEMAFIPEGDVYRLIIGSKLPSAERFEHWVFDEVLPCIRKHGAYVTPAKLEELMNDPDSWIKVLTALKEERAAKERLQLEAIENNLKVIFADAVSVSEGTILIGEMAKILKGNGIEIGQNRLFEKLRQDGYLIKRKGTDYNAPTQRAMDLGLFRVKETAITHSDGHVTISKTTKVTGKGQQWLSGKLLSAGILRAVAVNDEVTA